MLQMSYVPKKNVEKLTLPVRSLNYQVYRWGEPEGEVIFLIHGLADTGMSFQFVADAMPDDWCLIAPDLRGFGDSQWNPQGYWFPDYLADLDVLIEHFCPTKPARLVGHSMGGNIVTLYAGIFPERISHVASLDQFGLPDSDPKDAPTRYAEWIRQWRTPQKNALYDDIAYMVHRLKSLAPYLPDDRARFLAEYWVNKTKNGKFISKIDPGHKRINPILYHRQETKACWRSITAKSLLVLGDESSLVKHYAESGLGEDFKTCFEGLEEAVIKQCGHMLHLDQPEELARLLDEFLDSDWKTCS